MKHNIKVIIRIKLKSFDLKLMEQAMLEIINILKKSGNLFKGPIPLPTKIQRFDLLRSPHIDKKSRDQFEIRTHQRIIDIFFDKKSKIIESLVNLELLMGVDINIKLK